MMRYFFTFIQQALEPWLEFLKQHYISALQLFGSRLVRTREETLSEAPWEDEVEIRPERAVRLKRAYLHDLGCTKPECHGLQSHTCSLGDDSTVLPRVLELYHHRELPLLRGMRERLPEELVAQILAKVIVNNNANGLIDLRSLEDLQHISASILSEQIAEATPYRPLLDRAILENLPIRLDITFESSNTDRRVIARLPEFALAVLPHIRTLVLCHGLEDFLLDASDGMMSLRSQLLPFRLHEFLFEITTTSLADLIGEMGGPALMALVLGSSRLETSRKRVTYREDCEALVEAVKIAGIARAQYLRMDIVPWGEYGAKAVKQFISKTEITSVLPTAEIVECAVRKNLEGAVRM